MANNYLITGYWGEPHVTAENDRGINAGLFGSGKFVLPVGEQFKAEYVGNNTVRIYDGKLINNGAAGGIPAGEYIDILIANASQNMKRNDLIVFQYEQDTATLVEKGTFVVVQGEETSGTAADPELTQANLLTGKATFDQMALWRVSVSGTTIAAPVQVFDVNPTIAEAFEIIKAKASTATFNANVTATWTASGDYFYQDITVNGILATDNPIVDIKPGSNNADNVAYDKAIGKVFRITTSDNSIRVWAREAIATAFPIQLKVVR